MPDAGPLQLLSDLAAARMVELDAAEAHRPWPERIALMRETDRIVDALLGKHCWWRLYDPGLTGLLSHVNITIHTSGDRRMHRMHAKRGFERDQIKLYPRRHPLSKRSRAWVKSRLANWDRVEDLSEETQQNIFNALRSTAKVPYTDVGIAMIANAVRDEINKDPRFVPNSVFVSAAQAGETATLVINYNTTLVQPTDSITIV